MIRTLYLIRYDSYHRFENVVKMNEAKKLKNSIKVWLLLRKRVTNIQNKSIVNGKQQFCV